MKHKQYIKENPDYEMHLVDKIFGDGKTLIKFFYRQQISQFKQGFLAYVDSTEWEDDEHAVMDKVQDYLIETEGCICKEDFAEDKEEDGFDCCSKSRNNACKEHEKEFDEWFKDQFPKIDLEYGGVCFFGNVVIEEPFSLEIQ